jgi:hypothetical protein
MFCFIFLPSFITAGEILLERQIVGEFIPVYDLYVYVTDGKSTTGPRSLTVHILGKSYGVYLSLYTS